MRWATCFAVLVAYVYRIAVDQLPLPRGEGWGEGSRQSEHFFQPHTFAEPGIEPPPPVARFMMQSVQLAIVFGHPDHLALLQFRLITQGRGHALQRQFAGLGGQLGAVHQHADFGVPQA